MKMNNNSCRFDQFMFITFLITQVISLGAVRAAQAGESAPNIAPNIGQDVTQSNSVKVTGKKNVKKPQSITIIAITDFHGAIEPKETPIKDGPTLSIGGAANLASFIGILRSQIQEPTFLIDAGDLFQGTLESNLYEGKPVIDFYNHLKVDAAALGNHEFDFGPEGDKAVPREPGDDPLGALKARAREAKFPFLAANVVNLEGKRPEWLKSSIVIERGGVRLGIVGAATPGTVGSTNIQNIRQLKFLNPVPAIKAEVERLRQVERVDAVVLTTHIGAGCSDNRFSKLEDISSCRITEVFELVDALPEGLIDLVVAGHTHQGAVKRVKKTLIMQAYSNGRYLAWARIPIGSSGSSGSSGEISSQPSSLVAEPQGMVPICQQVWTSQHSEVPTCDSFQLMSPESSQNSPSQGTQSQGSAKKLVLSSAQPAEFFGQKIVPDKKVLKLLAPVLKQVQELKQTPLHVHAETPFARSYRYESSLGNLLADLLRQGIPGSDIGLMNGGGVRADLNQGDLVYSDIFEILPFDNQVATLQVNGVQLLKLFEVGGNGQQGSYNWSANVRLKYSDCKLIDAAVDGQKVEQDRIYKIATSDFLANGGSGVRSAGISAEQATIYWDRSDIQRELVVKQLQAQQGPLRDTDYYLQQSPRQVFEKSCDKQN